MWRARDASAAAVGDLAVDQPDGAEQQVVAGHGVDHPGHPLGAGARHPAGQRRALGQGDGGGRGARGPQRDGGAAGEGDRLLGRGEVRGRGPDGRRQPGRQVVDVRLERGARRVEGGALGDVERRPVLDQRPAPDGDLVLVGEADGHDLHPVDAGGRRRRARCGRRRCAGAGCSGRRGSCPRGTPPGSGGRPGTARRPRTWPGCRWRRPCRPGAARARHPRGSAGPGPAAPTTAWTWPGTGAAGPAAPRAAPGRRSRSGGWRPGSPARRPAAPPPPRPTGRTPGPAARPPRRRPGPAAARGQREAGPSRGAAL